MKGFQWCAAGKIYQLWESFINAETLCRYCVLSTQISKGTNKHDRFWNNSKLTDRLTDIAVTFKQRAAWTRGGNFTPHKKLRFKSYNTIIYIFCLYTIYLLPPDTFSYRLYFKNSGVRILPQMWPINKLKKNKFKKILNKLKKMFVRNFLEFIAL